MSLVVYEYPTLSILPQPLSFAEKFRVCVVPHSALDELHGADRAKEEDGGDLGRKNTAARRHGLGSIVVASKEDHRNPFGFWNS